MITLLSKAQHADFQWWPLMNISQKGNHYKLFTEEQLRLRDKASELYIVYSDIGIHYLAGQSFAFGPVYRPFLSIEGTDYKWNHYLLLDAEVKKNMSSFLFSYRMRYQWKMPFHPAEEMSHYSRNKFEIMYTHGKCKPYASVEIFVPLFKPGSYFAEIIRNTIGFTIPLSSHHSIRPLVMYIKDKAASDYQDIFILGGGYYLTL